MLLDKDSTAGQQAYLAPLLASSPLIAEEGIASIRGLNQIRQAKGLLHSLRSAPRLAGAFGTYASSAAIAPALAAYLINRWKPSAKPE
jgi:hypothetical protein